MKIKLIAAAIVSALSFCSFAVSAQSTVEPKREFRSTWVAGMGIDWPRSTNQATAKQQLITYLDNFARQNFTGVCIHVRPRADAYYKSSYEPWSADISGRRGTDPGWDPLAFAIEECHKRGLECYAWVNPYRVNANGHDYANDSRFTTAQDKEWDEKGWLIKSGSWTSFNPGHPEAREHCFKVIQEIYTNYAIDGMLFDDYFYPGDGMQGANGTGTDADSDDYELWLNSGTELSLYDWRRENTNTFVQALYDDIQKTRPDMRFGIGPAGVAWKSAGEYGLTKPSSGSDWQYDDIYADPLAWLADGSIDFISPQIYWARSNNAARYDVLCEWWSMVADHFNRHNYVSIASYKVETDEFNNGDETKLTGRDEIGAQIDLTRTDTRNNAPGAIYYNTSSMNGPSRSGLGDYLGETRYTHKVLVPLVDWKDRPTYSAVENLEYLDTSLSWTAVKGATEKSIIRYTVYAFPMSVTIESAFAKDGDGLDANYLAGVSYSNTFVLPADVSTDHWYAVCVYDGFGYESEPSIVGYATETAPSVTLVSPAEGATCTWDQTFTWTSVADANYNLQVAKDAEFSEILVNQRKLTATSATIVLDEFTPGEKLYWRVLSNVSGMLSGKSDVRSFIVPQPTSAQKIKLLTPVNGETIESTEIEFTWEPLTDKDVKTLSFELISADGTFDNPLISSQLELTSTSTTIETLALANGKYSWRIVTDGVRVSKTVSDSYTFEVIDLPLGTYEKGYVIKKDVSTYATSEQRSLESLWYRGVDSPFENLKFSDGKGALNRGMVATDRFVFISGRLTATQSAEIYLDQYDAKTGEYLRRIVLSTTGAVASLPCNDVLKDSEGNICIANLSLDIANVPIIIHKVNLMDGSLTQVARLTASSLEGTRVDHVAIFGDVDSNSFKVFAAGANSKTLMQWTVSDAWADASVTTRSISSFYPSTATGFGTAPRVVPESATSVFVDGASTGWSLYLFGRTATLSGSFANAADCEPIDFAENGGAYFTLGTQSYHVYNYASSTKGARFALSLAGNRNYTNMKRLWVFPNNTFGKINSSTCSTPVDAVVTSSSSANIYVYSPGNGLAAYSLTDTSASVEDIVGDENELSYSLDGLTVNLSEEARGVEVYTLTGALVFSATGAKTINLPASGVYIICADGLRAKLYAR